MGSPSAVIVRQESSALQHKDATARSDSERLKAGREDCTMSVNRFANAASPIRGVVADVAPAGAQMTKPVLQSPLGFEDDAESVATRVASTARRRTSSRMFEAGYLDRGESNTKRCGGEVEGKYDAEIEMKEKQRKGNQIVHNTRV
jgi:hypothetical protein